jgi:uncharacterized membrane protein YccC
VGLVRIEDLLVGALISLVVGILLWPRGARRELGRALANVYRSLVVYTEHAFDRVLGFDTAGTPDQARPIVIRSRDRADAAFDAFVTERKGGAFDQETAAFLLSSANQMSLAGDLLNVIYGVMGYHADSRAEGAREVRDQVGILLAGFTRLADRLSLSVPAGPAARVSPAVLRQAELTCLRRWQTADDVGKAAMAVVMAGEWVQNLARLEADLEGAAETAVEAARKPWWR